MSEVRTDEIAPAKSRRSVEDAVQAVRERFPLEGYIEENIAPYRTVGKVVLEHTRPGARLFDFGSGPCDKTAIASLLGCHCDAYDDLNDEWHRRGDTLDRIRQFAAATNVNLSEHFAPDEDAGYDMVMMNDVLEHIHDSPRELLNDLVSMLAPGGLLFITVPNLANLRKRLDLLRGRTNLPRFELLYWYRGPWRGPVREYVRSDLEKLVSYLGLELVALDTTHHMLKNLRPKLVPGYKMLTRLFPDVADTWVLLARRPAGWQARRALTDTEFASIYESVNKKGLY